jgi:uncharacterized protein (TIGR02246 family)
MLRFVNSIVKNIMYKNLLALITLSSLIPQTVMAEDSEILAELDAVWAEVSRTVIEGDFNGMAAVYHEDAVLVDSTSATSYPISQALERWKPGIEQTRNGETQAQVSFRFSQRLHDKETAHETGIFYYTSKPKGGEPSGGAVHFEALLVKKNGAWKMIMEHQKSSATEEEWNKLAVSVD